MFYDLLDVLACATCRGRLTLVLGREEPRTTRMRLRQPHVAVREGLLVCHGCARWYPIRDTLPEVLPDHLRNWERDRAWLAALREGAGPELDALWPQLEARSIERDNPADAGAHHKRAEMAVTERPLPKHFFKWAEVAPFNASSPLFSLDLLARYVTTVSRLGCGVNGVVFDLGPGTGWTTEWLVRLGYQAIGVDLCRDYILAGMPRRGEYLPHFVIGDIENIPLTAECVDAVLSFDAFHHIPDRPRAMAEFARIMRPGTTMVLTEPGIEHEHAAVSIDVMREHGILERGFDRAGLEGYIRGLPLGDVQHYRSDAHPHDLYSLRKAGTFATDSLSPRALVAGIEPDPPAPVVSAGAPIDLTVTITNRGDTRWLAATPDEIGEVHLEAQLFDPSHTLLLEEYARVKLPHDVAPGEAVRLRCALPPIAEAGDYLIELDMIDTGYLRFKDYAYQPVAWKIHVQPSVTTMPGVPQGEPRARIVPEELPLPARAAAPPVVAAPAPPPTLGDKVRDVWKHEGPGGIARRVLKRARGQRRTNT